MAPVLAVGRAGYFYPRSPCGERRGNCPSGCQRPCISIHALLAESDINGICLIIHIGGFLSTLSLRRATRLPTALRTPHHKFLSTLSLRRATAPNRRPCHYNKNFYPRSPCGERLHDVGGAVLALEISIHALLAESDRAPPYNLMIHQKFLSTLSLRRATF